MSLCSTKALLLGVATFVVAFSQLVSGSPSESTVRVMVRKEFQLQPDGSYKEISSGNENLKSVEIVPDFPEMYESAESSPPAQYAYSPYNYYDGAGSSNNFDFTADDVQDVMRQLEESHGRYAASASAPRSVAYHQKQQQQQYKIEKAPAKAYFLQQNVQPSGKKPSSIQEILRKPQQSTTGTGGSNVAATGQNSHYYSPKDQLNYDYQGGYDAPLPSPAYGVVGDSYGVPGPTGFAPTPSEVYGPPGGGHNQWASSYDDVKPSVGGVVNSLVHSVSGVHKTKAAQVSSVLHSKGELGSQLLNQGGHVINQAVHAKAEKAKIVANFAAAAPAKFSTVLKNKAAFASGVLDQGSRAINSVLNIKAAVANQASHLIEAKGKAATAVIKASGGTAADLILAKGKGIANLITSGGKAYSALLNHKGNKVEKIAEVLGGVAAAKGHLGGHQGGHQGGYNIGVGGQHGGWGDDGGISGGYSEHQNQYESYPYEELSDALKSVVTSPASSYGVNPSTAASSESEGTGKLNSAFKSIYDNFRQQQQPLGAYSSPVEVTAKAESATEEEKQQPSIRQSAVQIGESLNKMSKMFNNVANVITWLTPNKSKEV